MIVFVKQSCVCVRVTESVLYWDHHLEMDNDVIEEYKSSLSDLNCSNSKPMINALTIIAEENLQFAPQIVQVIENHINKASSDLKLHVLYLIDSIMKNVGRDYRSLFSERIVYIFSSVFEKVDEKTRFRLFKLRKTWTEIVPNEKLFAIDVSVKRMDGAWPITSKVPPVKSIHINPKFLYASTKKPEESASVKEMEKQQEVVKQLLAKQERLRLKRNEESKEAEKKIRKGPTVVYVHPSEEAPIERNVAPKLDPRLAPRDPRLQKSAVAPVSHKGLLEDKSVKNVSAAVKVQGPPQKHSPLPSVVLVPSESISQTREADVGAASRNDRKSENSIDSSKKKVDKSSPVEAKNLPVEQAKSEESASIKRFPSPQKLSSEPLPTEIQDKVQRGQDSSLKMRLDASPSRSKSSAAKERQLNADSKQAVNNRSLTPEKSKVDIKDPHVEIVKYGGRPSKGSPKAPLEAEKESETGSRSKATNEERRSSPRHRSRSPLHREDKKKDSKSSKTTSRSARHLPVGKPDAEKVESTQEPALANDVPPGDFPKVDTDLRVSTRSSDSPEKSNKRDNSAFNENENQENVQEEQPPVKKLKDEKENESAGNVSWLGNKDQDYRCKESGNKIDSRLGWAQYKAVHPDEFKSPLRQARENMENIAPGNEDFREAQDKHEQYGGGCDPETECDELGRPRINRRRNDTRFRGRRGKRYDQLSHREYYDHSEKGYDVRSMSSNPQFIIRHAEERCRAGVINEDFCREICDGIQKLTDSARKLGLRMPGFDIPPTFSNYDEQGEFSGPQMRHLNKTRGLVPPLQIPLRTKGPKPVPPSTCSFELDHIKRNIYFVDDKAIVVIDEVPRQIILKGQPTQVFIEEMNPITVKFDGKPVMFEVDGKVHTMKFGVPARELYIDDYPYEGKFGGPPFAVDIDDKPYSVKLGKPIPEVVFLEEPQHELYKKFLAGVGAEHSSARMPPTAEKDMEGSSSVVKFPIKTENADFTENEGTASSTAATAGPMPFDVDMRTPVTMKKEVEECERRKNFDGSEYVEVTGNRAVPDMKDVDYRHHPSSSMNFAPPNRDNSLYPPNVDFPSDARPDSMLHPGLPRNQIIKSEVDSNFRSVFTDSSSQMHQNIWNGPISHDSLEDRTRNSSERQEWANNQERARTWQECDPRHSQLHLLPPHDRPLPRMPNWRGGRFTPPYSQNEPTERVLPPRVVMAPQQQPNWRQPLENANAGNPNMPGWEWKPRGFRPDVPPMHSHPSEQGHPYNIQRNELKPPFENYRGPLKQLPPPPLPPRAPLRLMGNQLRPEMPVQMLRPDVPSMHSHPSEQGHPYNIQRNELKPPFENYRGPLKQLPPPPLPPRAPLRLMGNQLRPEMPVQMLRPTIPNNDLRNLRPPPPPPAHQRTWLPRNPLESMPPHITERPLLNFPHPLQTVSGPPGNPQLRTTLPPPPLPPNLPNIPVSLQGTAPFNLPRVPSPVVSEVSSVEQATSQSHVTPYSGPGVQIKSEIVDTSSCQGGTVQAANPGNQQLPQSAQQTIPQGSNVNLPLQNTGLPMTNEVAPSGSAAAPFVDLSTLMERLIAAGIISSKPTQPEKMEVVEPDVKSENDTTSTEEPTPHIEFATESLKCQYPGVISALFRGTQCASCGMRFKDTHGERYSRHIDWHFRVNRREKDGAKKAFSRKWYYDVEDWIQFEEFEDFEERALSFFELQADEELLQTPASVEVPTVPDAHGNETEASEVPDTPVDETPPAETSLTDKKQEAADDTVSTEDAVPKDETGGDDDIKTEGGNAEEAKEVDDVSVKQDSANESSAVAEEGTDKDKEEPVEEEPLESKPGEEEIIGVVTESDMEEEERKEPPKESKMVVMQSGGIVMKVRAESIQQPASPVPAASPDKDADQKKDDDDEGEDEFRPPTPDPRFKVLPPVKKGVELSGLCSIM